METRVQESKLVFLVQLTNAREVWIIYRKVSSNDLRENTKHVDTIP